jgi:hypothetical protein
MKKFFGQRITTNLFVGNPLIFALLQTVNRPLLRRIGLIAARFALLMVKVSDFQVTY